jgi:serine/threonine protein kinase
VPERIGRYEIEKELGRGGMAIVYLARDPLMDRPVAVKVLPRQFTFDPKFRERFRREARLVARLQHPAIVPVYDFGEEDDQLFLVMAYMSGGSLHDRLRGGPLALEECARIMNELAPALDAAHQRGMIHRDLKPANILFDEWAKPYLADFGITKLIAGSDTALTVTGGLVGTPAYMSPEQALALKELDGRSDLYALGVIFFQMVTGRTPYTADTPMGIALKHISEPVPRVADDNPTLPPAAQAVIDRAMAKEPGHPLRFGRRSGRRHPGDGRTAGRNSAAIACAGTDCRARPRHRPFWKKCPSRRPPPNKRGLRLRQPLTAHHQRPWIPVPPCRPLIRSRGPMLRKRPLTTHQPRPRLIKGQPGLPPGRCARPTRQRWTDHRPELQPNHQPRETGWSRPLEQCWSLCCYFSACAACWPVDATTQRPWRRTCLFCCLTPAWATPGPGPQDGMVLVYVPAGSFLMGSAAGGSRCLQRRIPPTRSFPECPSGWTRRK